MFEIVNRLLDADTHQCTRHRILAVGDDPETCAKLLSVLTCVNDYKAIVIDVEKTTPRPNSVSLDVDVECAKPYSDAICIPRDVIVVETRQRSWFKGHSWDYFTRYDNIYLKANPETDNIVYNVDVVIYALRAHKEPLKASKAMESFFNANKATAACKVVIVNVEDSIDDLTSRRDCNADCNASLFNFEPHVAVFKVKLDNIDESVQVVKEIMNKVIQHSPIVHD